MADTGWKIAGTGAGGAAPGSNREWNDVSAITNETSSFASRGLIDGTFTNFLQATNFGFGVPNDVIVTGVEARIRRDGGSSSEGAVKDHQVSLVLGGAIQTVNRAYPETWESLIYVNKDYGGSTDTWGATPSPAQVNSSNFGVVLRVVATNKPTPKVQTIWMRVHYEEEGSFYEKAGGVWRKGQLHERVAGTYRPGKLFERIGGIWRS